MYVNIGGDVILNAKDVVAVVDAKQMSRSPINAQFLERSKSENRFAATMESEPRTYIIARTLIYTSHVSARTLERRLRIT